MSSDNLVTLCVLTSSSNGQGRGAPESWTGSESAEAGWLTNSILKFFLGHPVDQKGLKMYEERKTNGIFGPTIPAFKRNFP